MTRTIRYLALHLLSSLSIISLAMADDRPRQGWDPSPPHESREGSVGNGYGGTVTEVTKNSITILWVNSPDIKPKTFAVSETLAAGKPGIESRVPPGWVRNPTNPMPVFPSHMYRLLDVKVGDCVGIFYARINGVDICDHICINRRPDGLIPPLPKEAEDLRDIHRKARERYKAQFPNLPESDPLLKAFSPPVPYHERMNAYWAKIAPMPREVKLPGPAIAP